MKNKGKVSVIYAAISIIVGILIIFSGVDLILRYAYIDVDSTSTTQIAYLVRGILEFLLSVMLIIIGIVYLAYFYGNKKKEDGVEVEENNVSNKKKRNKIKIKKIDIFKSINEILKYAFGVIFIYLVIAGIDEHYLLYLAFIFLIIGAFVEAIERIIVKYFLKDSRYREYINGIFVYINCIYYAVLYLVYAVNIYCFIGFIILGILEILGLIFVICDLVGFKKAIKEEEKKKEESILDEGKILEEEKEKIDDRFIRKDGGE